MVEFLDGPAAGQVLALRRSPIMLRVVCSPRGKWDALDQLGDEPRPGERIHVYRMNEYRGAVHVRCSPRSQSGVYVMADYRLWPDPPADATARDAAAWRAWCEALKASELAAKAAGGA